MRQPACPVQDGEKLGLEAGRRAPEPVYWRFVFLQVRPAGGDIRKNTDGPELPCAGC
jgi:hypothetical protein